MNRLAFALLLLAMSPLPGCSSSESGPAKAADDHNVGKQSPNTIAVPPDQQRLAGIRTELVEPRRVPRTLAALGQIMMDEERTAHIASYADGKVVDVLKLPGDVVQRGTVLAHLHSHSVHETVGALAQDFANVARAQAALAYATEKRDRYAHLYAIQAASLEQQQGSEQELVQAGTDLANATAAVTMEREHLSDLVQVSPGSITPANLYSFELVPIESPLAGTVITRSITPGTVLEPGLEAYTISNLHEVWMVASVPEADLSKVHVGEKAIVRSSAWPNQAFPGAVTLIGSMLDPTTRTAQVRVSLSNPSEKLKPGMFTTVEFDEAESREGIFVPEDALQELNGIQVVFVTHDGTHFAPHALKTMPAVNGLVEVTEGLQPLDRIAVAGAFMLKSDLLKGTIGDD